jgi:uncharacterized tellurite resistance protein B-like protein
MLKAIKRALAAISEDHQPLPARERRQLELAAAVLVHEARRADYAEGDAQESAVARAALSELFGLNEDEATELLAQGRDKAQHLTSFYPPLSVIKREWSIPERVRLIEHLWRVSFVDGKLDYYEDHYVRKIAHLLYIPHTENMLARNRARG